MYSVKCIVIWLLIIWCQKCVHLTISDSAIGVEKHAPHNIYSKENNDIMSNILTAKARFVPCQYENCSCYEDVILTDLEPFKSGINKSMIDEAKMRGVRYQLIDHHLYRSAECLFPARCSGVEYFINRLRTQLDDFEIIVNVRDWPQVSKFHSSHPLPVFSFSKTQDYYDIMYPAWSFWDGGPAIKLYPQGLGKWDNHRKKLIDQAKKVPWIKKLKKAFFRGSRTSSERDVIVLFSRKYPDIVDAAYTKNQAWKSNKDTLGVPPAEEVSLADHCKYRYLFNFRGVAASFRLRHIFLCHSLIFHVGEEWQEFFYHTLKPWIHYVPVQPDAKEDTYRSLLEFFINHDELAFEISENGFNFIQNHLKIDDVLCYWKLLLESYIKLQTFTPQLDQQLIDVTKY